MIVIRSKIVLVLVVPHSFNGYQQVFPNFRHQFGPEVVAEFMAPFHVCGAYKLMSLRLATTVAVPSALFLVSIAAWVGFSALMAPF